MATQYDGLTVYGLRQTLEHLSGGIDIDYMKTLFHNPFFEKDMIIPAFQILSKRAFDADREDILRLLFDDPELTLQGTKLEFSSDFNHPIEELSISSGIEYLIFVDKFNQYIENRIPSSVRYLAFGRDFNQNITDCVPLVTYLTLQCKIGPNITHITNNDSVHELFHEAISESHLEVIQSMLPHVNLSTTHVFMTKLSEIIDRIEIIKVLLEDKKPDSNIWINYAGRLASNYGHIDIVKLLLQDTRVNPNDLLEIATKHNHTKIIKLLINDDRTKFDNDMTNILYHLKENGRDEIIKLIYLKQKKLLQTRVLEVIESDQTLPDKQTYLSKLDCTGIRIRTDTQTNQMTISVVFDC